MQRLGISVLEGRKHWCFFAAASLHWFPAADACQLLVSTCLRCSFCLGLHVAARAEEKHCLVGIALRDAKCAAVMLS